MVVNKCIEYILFLNSDSIFFPPFKKGGAKLLLYFCNASTFGLKVDVEPNPPFKKVEPKGHIFDQLFLKVELSQIKNI